MSKAAVSSTQRLRSIDKRSRIIVTGYIRLCLVDIPIDIIHLCLLFYAIYDTFDTKLHGPFIIISDADDEHQNTIVQKTKNEGWDVAVGTFIVDVLQYEKCISEWTLRLHACPKEIVSLLLFAIGIIDNKQCKDSTKYCFAQRKEHKNYGWHIVNFDRNGDTFYSSLKHQSKRESKWWKRNESPLKLEG